MKKGVKNLRRHLDGTVFARHCLDCGCKWKIYQKVVHMSGCPSGN